MRQAVIGAAAWMWLWTGCTGGGGADTDGTGGSAGSTGSSAATTGAATTGDAGGTTGDDPTTSASASASASATSPTTGDTGDTGGGDDYPPDVLCPPAGDPRCGPPFDPNDPLPPDQLDAALTLGLETWRFPGKRGACAGCHSPDGYDLARVGFADDTIVRRAKDHVSLEQADALVAYVHALRQKYGLVQLLHPATFRPLQPNHVAWPETTPGLEVTDPQAQDERDLAFMNHLIDDRALLWAAGKVDSRAAAHQAYDELHAIDLTALRLGVPFDHLSEDGFYGEPHRSVFEWFPGMASAPKPGEEAAYYALVDAYLADPSDANLWKYYDALMAKTDCVDDLAAMGDPQYYRRACDWMRLKWRSLQVFSHMLRHGSASYPDALIDQQGPLAEHTALAAERLPIWRAGDFLRVQPLQRPQQTACFVEPQHPCTLLPPPVDDTIHSVPTYEDARIKQGEVFMQSWFVMSWQRDPGLLYSGEDFATFVGDYLESVLLAHYDVHHAFVVAKTAVEKSAATAWLDAPGFRPGLISEAPLGPKPTTVT
jgi:hypothetical protein